MVQEDIGRALTLEALSRVGTSFAHDMKNDLTAALYHVEDLEFRTRGNEEVKRSCDAIRDLVRAALRRAWRLRMLLNSDPPKREVLSVSLILSQFASSMARIDVPVTLPEGDALLVADRNEIEFVLEMLVENSIRATRPLAARETIHVSATMTEDEVLLICRDRGRGMSPATIARCFEPFFTTSRNGTGLGLFASQRIVDNHGGRITVESREGESTCFTIVLPRHKAREIE